MPDVLLMETLKDPAAVSVADKLILVKWRNWICGACCSRGG